MVHNKSLVQSVTSSFAYLNINWQRQQINIEHRQRLNYKDWHDDVIIWSHYSFVFIVTLQLRHNGRDYVSYYQSRDCLLNHLFRHRSDKTSKLCVTGPRAHNSPLTDEIPAQRSCNAIKFFFLFDDVSMTRPTTLPVVLSWLSHLITKNGLDEIKFYINSLRLDSVYCN